MQKIAHRFSTRRHTVTAAVIRAALLAALLCSTAFASGCMGSALSDAQRNPEADWDFSALLDRADTYRERGRYLEAISFYRDICMNAGNQQVAASAHLALGELYYNYIGDTGQALHHLRAARNAGAGSAELIRISELAQRITSGGHGQDNGTAGPGQHPPLPHLDDQGRVRTSAGDRLRTHVRVLIGAGTGQLNISCPGGMRVISSDGSMLAKKNEISCRVIDGYDHIFMDGKPLGSGTVSVQPEAHRALRVNGTPYRGLIHLHRAGSRLIAINRVLLDEYLYGVLPREVSPAWPAAALQAQAIAARTYAVYHMCLRCKKPYDVFSTTSSQVYGGMSREHPATTQAVKATAGRILIHNRRVPLTLYHANSGGQTESLSGVWAGRRSYLTAVADDFSKGRPGSRWRSTLTGASICDHLAGFDIHARELAGLSPLARSDTRRIQKIELSIDGKPLLLSGNSFRLMLGPGTVKSTLFSIQKTKDGYVFEGSGYGHGVGMSQWGAYSMARAGHSPAAILEHYYPGTRIVQIQ